MDELKPCPFCGGTNLSEMTNAIECDDCHAEIVREGTYDFPKEAWNRRTLTEAQVEAAARAIYYHLEFRSDAIGPWCDGGKNIAHNRARALARAALETLATQPAEPSCKTCNGRGIVPTGDGYSVDGCPTCKPAEQGVGLPNELQEAIRFGDETAARFAEGSPSLDWWKTIRAALLDATTKRVENLHMGEQAMDNAEYYQQECDKLRQQLTESEKEKDVLRRRLVSALDRERRRSEAAK